MSWKLLYLMLILEIRKRVELYKISQNRDIEVKLVIISKHKKCMY